MYTYFNERNLESVNCKWLSSGYNKNLNKHPLMKIFCKVLFLCSLIYFNINHAQAQQLNAYKLVNQAGVEVQFSDVVEQALKSEIILFGELHNNPISHWLQFELLRALNEAEPHSVTLGLEMFEADNQVLIDEYFQGLITTRNFEQEIRLWRNYTTDIKPLVEFARANNLPLIATNIPRRYASMVYRDGLEALENLSDDAKQWIAPLPIEVDLDLPGYKHIMEAAHGHGGENLPKSQAVKDVTMAHFIFSNLYEGRRFLHIHGTYHSDNFEGIYWYLKQLNPELNILTISTNEADINQQTFELTEDVTAKANFILLIPPSMTKTH